MQAIPYFDKYLDINRNIWKIGLIFFYLPPNVNSGYAHDYHVFSLKLLYGYQFKIPLID